MGDSEEFAIQPVQPVETAFEPVQPVQPEPFEPIQPVSFDVPQPDQPMPDPAPYDPPGTYDPPPETNSSFDYTASGNTDTYNSLQDDPQPYNVLDTDDSAAQGNSLFDLGSDDATAITDSYAGSQTLDQEEEPPTTFEDGYARDLPQETEEQEEPTDSGAQGGDAESTADDREDQPDAGSDIWGADTLALSSADATPGWAQGTDEDLAAAQDGDAATGDVAVSSNADPDMGWDNSAGSDAIAAVSPVDEIQTDDSGNEVGWEDDSVAPVAEQNVGGTVPESGLEEVETESATNVDAAAVSDEVMEETTAGGNDAQADAATAEPVAEEPVPAAAVDPVPATEPSEAEVAAASEPTTEPTAEEVLTEANETTAEPATETPAVEEPASDAASDPEPATESSAAEVAAASEPTTDPAVEEVAAEANETTAEPATETPPVEEPVPAAVVDPEPATEPLEAEVAVEAEAAPEPAAEEVVAVAEEAPTVLEPAEPAAEEPEPVAASEPEPVSEPSDAEVAVEAEAAPEPAAEEVVAVAEDVPTVSEPLAPAVEEIAPSAEAEPAAEEPEPAVASEPEPESEPSDAEVAVEAEAAPEPAAEEVAAVAEDMPTVSEPLEPAVEEIAPSAEAEPAAEEPVPAAAVDPEPATEPSVAEVAADTESTTEPAVEEVVTEANETTAEPATETPPVEEPVPDAAADPEPATEPLEAEVAAASDPTTEPTIAEAMPEEKATQGVDNFSDNGADAEVSEEKSEPNAVEEPTESTEPEPEPTPEEVKRLKLEKLEESLYNATPGTEAHSQLENEYNACRREILHQSPEEYTYLRDVRHEFEFTLVHNFGECSEVRACNARINPNAPEDDSRYAVRNPDEVINWEKTSVAPQDSAGQARLIGAQFGADPKNPLNLRHESWSFARKNESDYDFEEALGRYARKGEKVGLDITSKVDPANPEKAAQSMAVTTLERDADGRALENTDMTTYRLLGMAGSGAVSAPPPKWATENRAGRAFYEDFKAGKATAVTEIAPEAVSEAKKRLPDLNNEIGEVEDRLLNILPVSGKAAEPISEDARDQHGQLEKRWNELKAEQRTVERAAKLTELEKTRLEQAEKLQKAGPGPAPEDAWKIIDDCTKKIEKLNQPWTYRSDVRSNWNIKKSAPDKNGFVEVVAEGILPNPDKIISWRRDTKVGASLEAKARGALDKRPGDDAGHLIALVLGADPRVNEAFPNLTSQNAPMNRGQGWRDMEMELEEMGRQAGDQPMHVSIRSMQKDGIEKSRVLTVKFGNQIHEFPIAGNFASPQRKKSSAKLKPV